MVPGFYRFINGINRILLRVFRGFRVRGRENVPADEPVVFASNHIGLMDPFALAAATDHLIGYLSKEELFFFPVGNVIRRVGAVPVDRGGNATSAVRASLAVLEQGLSLGVFPEGTRNRGPGLLLPPKRGVVLIARRSGCRIVPVAIRGTRGLFGRVVVSFGPPVSGHLDPEDPASPDQVLDEVMGSIRQMLEED